MPEPIPVLIDPDIAAIVPEYLENRRLDVERIRQAVVLRDFAMIGHIGHKMKGTGQGYGFVVLTELGVDLEIAAEERDLDSVLRSLAILEDFLGRVQPRIR